MTSTFAGKHVTLSSAGGATRSTVVGQPIAKGGEGEIFADASRQDHVLKLYFQPGPARSPANDAQRAVLVDKQAKIAAMLANAPEARAQVSKPRGAEAPIVQIAWPQEMVLAPDGSFLGFSMRRVDIAATTPLFSWRSALSRKQEGLDPRDDVRLYLLRNLAALVAYVNKVGHAVVDLKDVNVLAYRSGGHVALIDCDGFAIRDGARMIPATAATPNLTAPEFQPGGDLVAHMDEEQDRFALAVMIFEILSAGRHPAGGKARPGRTVPDGTAQRIQQRLFHLGPDAALDPPNGTLAPYLPDATLALFERAFLAAPTDRPTAAAWRDHLDALIAGLKTPTADFPMRRCPTCQGIDYGKGCPKCAKQPQEEEEPLQRTFG
ncbi:hypothetical protein MU516_19320, partial [Paracoccus sp. YLB-12]